MISYIGGKSRMAKWISEYIPKDIESYIEVFGGAFWVYLKGDVSSSPKLEKVVYNDKNRFMVNLIQCCTDPLMFYNHIEKIKSQDEKLFYQYQKEINNTCDLGFPDFSMDLAMKYAYVATQVFSGSKIMESKYIDLKGKYKCKFDSFRDRLLNFDIVNRLIKISQCENLDYTECISKYDGTTSFFYLDPPYWKTEKYYSNHDFDALDHETLSKWLQNIRGKFALSYYYFEELEEMYPRKDFRWVSKEFTKAAGASKGKKQNKGTELLIMNY
jgi:DNA adenine methylase|tara:strand:+ start:191 stop:1003 length:813 start_codon:yes stop_codon:yes gene_type:complete